MPNEPSRGMETLEALYGNIPEGFQEELTLANFPRNLNMKESAVKPKRKEEKDLEVMSKKLADPLNIKNITRQNSSSTDSNAQSIDFGKGLQAVKPPSLEGQNIQNPTLLGHLKVPSDQSNPTLLGHLKSPSDQSNNISRYILKGSGRRDQYVSDVDDNISMFSDGSSTMAGSRRKSGNFSTDFDVSYTSAHSVAHGKRNGVDQDKSMQKRQGTPHTNICSICDKTAGWGKCRCLVCGRVYCKNCVTNGMGDMPEGRKCIACVGHRFSQRYIARAGNLGCCVSVPSPVKQAELKWAELGARKPRNRPTQATSQSPRHRRLSPRKSNRVSPTRENRAP
ncbi:hypothetical protein SUGI_0595010 [Cryptomeria japonica]|nr:hypothetical protein SUGI_0595010 [Cryptomeria japonica]